MSHSQFYEDTAKRCINLIDRQRIFINQIASQWLTFCRQASQFLLFFVKFREIYNWPFTALLATQHCTEYYQNNWLGQRSSRCRDRGAEHLENTSAGRSFVQTEVMPVKSPGKPPTSVAALFAPHLLQLRTTRWLNILTSDSHIFAHLILAPALKISKLFV